MPLEVKDTRFSVPGFLYFQGLLEQSFHYRSGSRVAFSSSFRETPTVPSLGLQGNTPLREPLTTSSDGGPQEGSQLGLLLLQQLGAIGLQDEAQVGLGVGRTNVDPPVIEFDHDSVHTVQTAV